MKREVTETEDCPFLEERGLFHGICHLTDKERSNFERACVGLESWQCKLNMVESVSVCRRDVKVGLKDQGTSDE